MLVQLLIITALSSAWCQDWPTFRHDHARSGIASGPGPSEGTVAWTARLGGSVDGSPIVIGDRIYVGNNAGVVFALERETGQIVWQQATGGAIVGAAEVADGRLFIGSADGFLYALDAADGRMLWRHRTLRPVLAAPVFLDGKVIFGSMDGTMRAVEPASGRTVWRVSGEGGISATAAVRDDVLYYGDEEGNLYARRAADGEVVWQGKLSGRVIAAPKIAGERLLAPLMSLSRLAPPPTEYLTAWALDDGRKLWAPPKPAAQSVMGSPVAVEGIAWAFTVEGYVSEGKLWGHKLADGEPVVEQKLGRLVVDGSPAVAEGTLYAAGQDGVVRFIDAKTGDQTRGVQLGGKVFSSPAIAHGRMYVGAQDGRLYCIH